MNNQEKKYLPTYEIWSRYRNALMGFAIINVIFFHFIKDYRAVYEKLPKWMLLYYRYFGSAGVDIFLFLSGLGLYYSFKKKNGVVQYGSYLISKCARVLIPYLLIAVPSDSVRRIVQQGKDWKFVVKDLLFINFFQIGESWYWYIGMICFCYAIYPFLFRYVELAKNNLKEILLFAVLFGAVTAGCHYMSIYAVEFYKNTNGAMLRFFPLILGTFVGKRSYEKRPLTWVNAVWILPWLYYCSYAKNSNVLVMRYMLGCNALMMCFLLCLIFFAVEKMKWHPLQDILNFFGKYTLELYLSHVMLRVVMTWHGWRPGTYKREMVMLFFAALISVVLHVASGWIQKKILPSKTQ